MIPELEIVSLNLLGNARKMIRWGRRLSPEHLDFTFDPAAPTPRSLIVHAWLWLVCDRQHIEEPDAARHAPVPEAPADPEALFVAFGEEIDRWQALLESMTEERLAEPRRQFNDADTPWSVRDAIHHMLQNILYKLGQLSYLYYALGYDGSDPYDAPLPNPYYAEMAAVK